MYQSTEKLWICKKKEEKKNKNSGYQKDIHKSTNNQIYSLMGEGTRAVAEVFPCCEVTRMLGGGSPVGRGEGMGPCADTAWVVRSPARLIGVGEGGFMTMVGFCCKKLIIGSWDDGPDTGKRPSPWASTGRGATTCGVCCGGACCTIGTLASIGCGCRICCCCCWRWTCRGGCDTCWDVTEEGIGWCMFCKVICWIWRCCSLFLSNACNTEWFL